MNLFLNRLFRAAKLDTRLYQEVIADTRTMFQAMMAVFIYCAASAYGGFGRAGVAGINFGMITTLLGWYVWAFSTYFVGRRLFPEAETKVDRKAVLRAMGFASSPGLIRLLGLIPDFAGPSLLIASVWMFLAAAVAIKQAMNYKSIYRAAGACIMGWIISAIFQGLMYISLLSVFGIPAQRF
jgi:hypothetical protein